MLLWIANRFRLGYQLGLLLWCAVLTWAYKLTELLLSKGKNGNKNAHLINGRRGPPWDTLSEAEVSCL
jgi:hypothetical protein